MGAWSKTAFPDPAAGLHHTMLRGLAAARQQIRENASLLGAARPREDPDLGMVARPPTGDDERDEFMERLLQPVESPRPPPPPPPGARFDPTESDYESLLSIANPPRVQPAPVPKEEAAPRRSLLEEDEFAEFTRPPGRP